MAIVPSAWTSQINGYLVGVGFIGTRLSQFTSAIGSGSAMSIIGKSFATTDVGTVPGGGSGIGVGLTGVPAATTKAALISAAISKGLIPTSRTLDVFQAISDALESQLGLASLASTHTPVFVGSGTVTPGSIPVSSSEWGGNVETSGQALGMLGSKWADFAGAIGQACALSCATATGTVVITGSPSSITTVPGTGAGSGVIS